MKRGKKDISERAKLLEQRRLKAGRMFESDRLSQTEIAAKLSVSPSAVCQWHAAWSKNHEKGLRSKGHPGFESTLTEEKKKRLRKMIVDGPAKVGYATDFWTVDRIRDAAKKKLRVKFGRTHVWQTILSLGFSAQKPERRARERNEKAIEEWKLKTFPKLKKIRH